MLEKLFTSKTRVKLLRLLMFSGGRGYHLREISRLTGVTPIYASKELKNLMELKLVNNVKLANLSIYSINQDNIFLNDLRQLFIKADTEYTQHFLYDDKTRKMKRRRA